jgi:hypothetical protein
MNKLEPKKVRRRYWDNARQRFIFEYIYLDDIPAEYRGSGGINFKSGRHDI